MNNNTLVGITVGVLLLVAIGMFFFAGKSGKEAAAGDYNTFAQCLYDSGLRMYGSATCKFCAQQRAMLGPSFEFIKEIECDPRNPMPQTERCIKKNITGTPTWIRERADGSEIYRFTAGVQSLEKLSEVSECPLIKDSDIERNNNKAEESSQ
ncbi:MAG: hypothetical protein HYT93_03605 [Parcubacteria group bacterium]|nr:hypothetical protein [Parcubacteria group bacterium]